ncbi:hypothetical protein JVX93_21550 [Mycolicibacterium boenickei]|nr:hypothetical protein JVX93_21550 [Mycolicibacterium boenickei]
MADFPTLAEIVAEHADSWIGPNNRLHYGITEPGFRSCSCGQWMDDNPGAQFSRSSFGEHVQAEWVKARTITNPLELDRIPAGSVVRSSSGTIAARFDGRNGVVFGDDRPFPWHALSLPVEILWTPGDVR